MVNASNPSTGCWKVQGKQVSCSHCGGWEFERREALLRRAPTTALGTDGVDHVVTILVCTNCGHAETFYDGTKVEPVE